MTTYERRKPNRRQIVAAIAAKDIVDGWRSRTLLGIALAVLVTLLTAQALPLLLGLGGRQTVVIVADRQSALTARLAQDDTLRVARRATAAAALEEVAENGGGSLGIVLPADLEARLAASDPVTLDAFTPFATSAAQLAEARDTVAAAITAATGADVAFAVQTLYPGPDAGGRPVLVTTSLLLIALVPGLLIVPLLILEEKEARTLDALLVSPATPGVIITGKGLAGIVYGLIAVAVGLFVFRDMVVHWGAAVAALLLTVLLGVAIGLLVGTLFDDQATMNLWLGLILMVLIVPAGLRVMPRLAHLSDTAWYPYLPSVALARLLQAAMGESLPLGDVLPAAVLAAALTVGLLGLVVGAVRRRQG
jgi:ABC-2 type transport system permease protein